MKIKFIIFCLLTFNAILSFSQKSDLRFRRISPPGGYSFQAIHSFNQDKYGYMWMGGFKGVIRYNPKETVRFLHKAGENDGLPSNTTTAIVIDKKNNIWVCTDKGLCLFNHKTQQFNRYNYTYEDGTMADKYIYSADIDKNGRLWIADENFLGYLDTENKNLVRITSNTIDQPRHIYNDETNRMWIGTANGSIYQINPENKNIDKIIDGPGSLARTICTSNNMIWVGYQSHGARQYDLEGNLVRHYSYPQNPQIDIESASIRKIWRDTQGQIWIGSYYGLFKTIGNELMYFSRDNYHGLPHNSIFDIFEDSQGGIWIGTWSGGVAYLHLSDNKFNNFRHSKEPYSISDNMISSFIQTNDGTLYVGTELFGLNKFDKDKSTFTPVNVKKPRGILDIKDMEIDHQGGLWIASAFNGAYYKPENKTEFIHFPAGTSDGKHISSHEVYALCPSYSGMWIGTSFGGINFYNFKTKRINYLHNKIPFSSLLDLNIRSISTDTDNNLWITTSDGLYKINPSSGDYVIFNTNSTKKHRTNTRSFYFAKQLSDGLVWIGTESDGINLYDKTNDSLSFFDADGLIHGKDVYGIIEGQKNNIWITTNDGLILYNPEKNSSRRFVMTDGIQGNLFNPNAIFKDKEDNLYFGGTNGFSLLEPKEIAINERKPNILISKIEVNNTPVIPAQTGVNQFEKILLKSDERSISLHFSADNYLLPEKNQFKYRLTNYIDDWVLDVSNGTANFVNVPAGNYTFEVKACNNDGIWNENPAQIDIEIEEFWYLSTLALSLYLITFMVIFFLIIRFYFERSQYKKELLIEKIKYEHEENLHEMKLKFFTNISHEFRTPLTLINGPVKNLLKAENLTTDQQNQLDTVKRNTNRLLQLINQIMDMRKAEKGFARLNISKIEMVDFINQRVFNFTEEARSRNIKLEFKYTTSAFNIEADAEKLDKMIFNLLSNAFKFTPTNGEITVTLQDKNAENQLFFSNQLSFGELDNEDYIEIVILDSGHGINSEDLPHIFERFEQANENRNRANSTGIGLNLCKDFTLMHRGMIIVQSTPGEGTRFSLRLPTRQKAQKIMFEKSDVAKNIDSFEIPEKKNIEPLTSDKEIKILIVEDNKDLRNYIVNLVNKNYSVHFAENGKQGLNLLNKHNIELVISDVMMPEMDGFEFCQTIKTQIETSHIPVILLTALSSVDNTTTGLEKGADAYISKPFDDNILLSQIINLLQQRKRLQESYAKKFISKQPIDIGNLDNYFLNKVNSIIENAITDENFSVDVLAEEMGFSRSQLYRKLKQITDQSTSEYITMVKIKKATTLLNSKNYTIDEVAYKTGFNSHSYFSKCFKKIHGQTPKEYVKGI